MSVDYREVAKACREAAKWAALFKAGEEFAVLMENAAATEAEAKASLDRYVKAIAAAQAEIVTAQATASSLVTTANAEAAAVRRAIPGERERAMAEVTAARVILDGQRTEIAGQNKALANREKVAKANEDQIADVRQKLSQEESRIASLRNKVKDEAQRLATIAG